MDIIDAFQLAAWLLEKHSNGPIFGKQFSHENVCYFCHL